MKKLIVLIVFVFASAGLYAQHYGGISFTPYAVENNGSLRFYSSPFYDYGSKATFGYSVGYQGLLMPKRRFSFSYGLLYSYAYNEATRTSPRTIYDSDENAKTEIGKRVDIKALQIPLWWRYNILKNKKWQPFIAVSTTVNYALVSEHTFLYEDSPPEKLTINNPFYLSLEVGVGVNYTSNDWMFTVQPTFGGNYLRQLGVGFSVMKKF
jgi:hypothetical protein